VRCSAAGNTLVSVTKKLDSTASDQNSLPPVEPVDPEWLSIAQAFAGPPGKGRPPTAQTLRLYIRVKAGGPSRL
jgi:hypothetical protein